LVKTKGKVNQEPGGTHGVGKKHLLEEFVGTPSVNYSGEGRGVCKKNPKKRPSRGGRRGVGGTRNSTEMLKCFRLLDAKIRGKGGKKLKTSPPRKKGKRNQGPLKTTPDWNGQEGWGCENKRKRKSSSQEEGKKGTGG